MDKVRFGRALGFGARQAGKALWQAADAALKPDPNAASPPRAAAVSGNGAPSAGGTSSRQTGSRLGRNVQQVRTRSGTLQRESKRFGEAMWGPVARASGVLWLELTGVFFGLFAFTAGVDLYRHHRDFTATGPSRQHVWFAAAMFALFSWFTVSSFLRARKRSRR